MSAVRNVVLFDIDGTLLLFRGAGRAAFALALQQAYGSAVGLDAIHFAGATDLGVLMSIEARQALPADDGRRARFFNCFPGALQCTLREATVKHYAGARNLLERLFRHPDILLGLVTGNAEPCAWLKLEHAGLRPYFSFGAFGHEHHDRNELARRARQRARAQLHAQGVAAGLFFLIGDTPADIAAAHAIGARAIAVSGEFYSAGQLEEAGADMVIADFTDTRGLLRLLTAPAGQG